ncbi:hypothetical protein HanXRQr2_Chr15g0709481 [Helianthus annuus]|uniref:Uncharacterized protein n=1 Tax=Helianthus annuus TaxID=4232 RepID=A0A9K3H4B5_HELAN|nr:hypothetical protein HanXRQr2_Chr15g0709481 [Helianthus annuus]
MFSGTPPLDSPPPSDEPQRRRPEIERERERTGGRRLGPVVCVSVRRSAFWSSGSCLYPTSFPFSRGDLRFRFGASGSSFMWLFRLSFGSGSIYFHLRFWYEPGCLVRVLFGSAQVSLGSGLVNEGQRQSTLSTVRFDQLGSNPVNSVNSVNPVDSVNSASQLGQTW